MKRDCPKCKAEDIEGEDLGDNGTFLNFQCDECGHAWGEECYADFVDQARSRAKYER